MNGQRVAQLCRDKCDTPRHKHERISTIPEELMDMALIHKLHSEVSEVERDLTNPEEYGDVLDALIELADRHGITLGRIMAASHAKRERKGGFERGLLWAGVYNEENTDVRQAG